MLTRHAIIIFLLILTPTNSLEEKDLYRFVDGKKFGDDIYKQFDLPVRFPYWNLINNTRIDVVNSGVVRLAGLAAADTLDILILAIATPRSAGDIYYFDGPPTNQLQENLTRDIGGGFNASYVVMVTWHEVEFYPERYSTFQAVLASNGTQTYAILNLLKLQQTDQVLQFYPEVDFRYSYDGGSQFLRTGFLANYTGVETATESALAAATTGTNAGVAGRWVFALNVDPTLQNSAGGEGGTKPTATLPPSIAERADEVSNYTGVAYQGKFKFDTLKLDGVTITSKENNDEIQVILTKKEEDPRYTKLTNEMKAWLEKSFSTVYDSTKNRINIEITNFKSGSLIVEYYVTVDGEECVFQTSPEECLDRVKEKLDDLTGEGVVVTDAFSGELDTRETSISSSVLCAKGISCDANAVCIEYPDRLTFGCVCNAGFRGEGFPGQCQQTLGYWNLHRKVALGSGVTAAFASIITIIVVTWIIRKENKLMDGQTNRLTKSSTRSLARSLDGSRRSLDGSSRSSCTSDSFTTDSRSSREY